MHIFQNNILEKCSENIEQNLNNSSINLPVESIAIATFRCCVVD